MHPLVTALIVAMAVATFAYLFVLDRRVKALAGSLTGLARLVTDLDESLTALIDMRGAEVSKHVSITGAQRAIRRAQ